MRALVSLDILAVVGISKSLHVLNLEQKKPVLLLVVLGTEWTVAESIQPILVRAIGLTKEIGAYLPSTKLYFIYYLLSYFYEKIHPRNIFRRHTVRKSNSFFSQSWLPSLHTDESHDGRA